MGEPAPLFSLPSLLGSPVELSAYRELLADHTEAIRIAPNLYHSAKSFFGQTAAPFPFVCDRDKRLYSVYGLGDRGALVASRTAGVSFSTRHREGGRRHLGARGLARRGPDRDGAGRRRARRLDTRTL